jgi:hypothetical protein
VLKIGRVKPGLPSLFRGDMTRNKQASGLSRGLFCMCSIPTLQAGDQVFSPLRGTPLCVIDARCKPVSRLITSSRGNDDDTLQWHFERESNSLEFSLRMASKSRHHLKHFERKPNSLEFSLHLSSVGRPWHLELGKRAKFPGIFPRSAKTSCSSLTDGTC